MSEYELQVMEVLTATTLAATELFMFYVTLLASYLVAAYIAGRQLTSIQSFTVSVLFVFGAFLSAYATFNYMARAIEIATPLVSLYPDRYYGANPTAQKGTFILQVTGILACLKFMWDVRHPKMD